MTSSLGFLPSLLSLTSRAPPFFVMLGGRWRAGQIGRAVISSTSYFLLPLKKKGLEHFSGLLSPRSLLSVCQFVQPRYFLPLWSSQLPFPATGWGVSSSETRRRVFHIFFSPLFLILQMYTVKGMRCHWPWPLRALPHSRVYI